MGLGRLLALSVVVAMAGAGVPHATAQPRGDIWVADCTENASGYLIICDRYGGADFQTLVPPQCDFGSRLGCRLTACEMFDHFRVRGADGRALSREMLCARDEPSPAEQARQPARNSTNVNCERSATPALCFACAEQGAGVADYFCSRMLR